MKIDFEKGGGLVPAIIQDAETAKVLMLGYMNEEALEKTKSSGKITFFSRSKNRLWVKGEQSGNFMEFVGVKADCDKDALLIQARPTGPVCHTGSDTCWEEENQNPLGFINTLEDIIADRKRNAGQEQGKKDSYVSSLFVKGKAKIAQKVGEEAVETVIEALDGPDDLFLNENADLLFHQLILLQARGFRLNDVLRVLKDRHNSR
ncbi:phosphoribosyl-ATP pyrophosphatase /phosphoribosyl-AMP cyclohydrolase [Robiginitalea myxolifaciens]|uniref:Histidine biosynthesis bifunctional protein HisIE n=1 Tax=Robiginitalea myxolifaciens TaxID=400055 RepID=A0A1I6GXB5_9FLAO|nr:bifunctional phosphoribosyl-AMP cyclohydrolase/phosphoribosyl-ATP diphosphatase HisIE [Robiginitalea myxolifaciens]SFR46711.1 phosphoribosyl-ATP pyrophosphatase /phosphoribosyl-AMP cyclohydrolase [Robiginitalea myxolifaciens]